MNVFFNVIRAIFIRELGIRSGNKRLFYIILALEPLLPIGFFALLHSSISGTFLSSEEYIVYLFSGFLIFNSFKNIAAKGYDAIDSNSGLFIYKQVKPIDALFARFLTEFFIFLISFSMFLFLGALFDLKIIPDNIGQVILGFFLLFLFALSLSIFFASLTLKFKFLKKIVNIIFMPLLFLSAVFYSIKNIPYQWQDELSLNPVALLMELIHHAWFEKISIVEINFLYIFFWILGPAAIGFFYYIFSKKII